MVSKTALLISNCLVALSSDVVAWNDHIRVFSENLSNRASSVIRIQLK
jgi:hypothetical protein